MTRAEAMLKLLAIEPETRSRLILVTGWPADETESVLDQLTTDGMVTYRNGTQGTHGERLYLPATRNAGSLHVAAGKGRKRVRDDGGGLVRSQRAVASVWAWGSDQARGGEEE